MQTEILLGNLRDRDLGVDDWIMLKCIVKKGCGRAWVGLIWHKIRKNGGFV